MDVKEAVALAKVHIAEVFKAEDPTNIGLEEVVFDEVSNTWKVTVGFSRPWDYESKGRHGLAVLAQLQAKRPTRQYKVVVVNDSKESVTAIRMRG